MAGRGTQAGARGKGGQRPSRSGPRRHSPAVYRRRRIVVGGLLVLVLLMIGGGAWALVRGSGQSSAAGRTTEDGVPLASASSSASPTASSSASSSGSPSASSSASAGSEAAAAVTTAAATPTASPTPTCDPAKFTVAASTDKSVYAPTQDPVLTLKVTNQNSVPCTINVGTSQMEFLIVSGADRIFDSKDCQDGAADLLKTLAPGATETANFPWPRTRSTEGCRAISVKPLPGTYVLTTSLGPLDSPKTVFTLQ